LVFLTMCGCASVISCCCMLLSHNRLITDFLRYERDEQWKEDEILAAKIKKFLAVRTVAWHVTSDLCGQLHCSEPVTCAM